MRNARHQDPGGTRTPQPSQFAAHFSKIFRDEHRQVRDALLDLIQAFQQRSQRRIQELLQRIATLTGPHFRYEEESLYPALVEIFGAEYIEKLLGDHDRAIGRAKRLVEVAAKESLSDQDVAEATKHIRAILPHVSDCDGLSIMVERLPAEKVQAVLKARDRCRKDELNVIQWAESVRQRPAVAP